MTLRQSKINIEFVVVDQMLSGTQLSFLDVLRSRPNLSTMRSIEKASTIEDIITSNSLPKEICFEENLCLGISKSLLAHFFEMISAKKFTFQLLENSAFKSMEKTRLNALMSSVKQSNDFMTQHIFFGVHGNDQVDKSTMRMLGFSIKPKHPVAEFLRSLDNVDVTRNGKESYVIVESIRVKEGLVQILKPIE